MRRVRNYVLAVHRGAVDTAILMTGGIPFIGVVPYVVSLPMVSALTFGCFVLDPHAFEDGGEFDASPRRSRRA